MTKIIGHRGAKAYYPENTLLSFQKALEMGADGIELDIHYTKDGEIVVFHDFTLDRMTGAEGNIYDWTLEALQDLTVEAYGQTDEIPTLEAVLQALLEFQEETGKEVVLNVELKAGSAMYKGIEARTVALCDRYLKRSQVIYSSFDHYALKTIKELGEDLQIGILTMAGMVAPWTYVQALGADFYHPYYMTLMGYDVLKGLTDEEIPINAYTVNETEAAKPLLQAGIAGLITDVPDLMIALRKQVQG